jgi:hypothetical protein
MELAAAMLVDGFVQHDGSSRFDILGAPSGWWDAPNVPGPIAPTFFLALSFTPDEVGQHLSLRLVLTDPDHAELLDTLFSFVSTAPAEPVAGMAHVSGVPITLEFEATTVGAHRFEVFDAAGVLLGAVPFAVRLAPPAKVAERLL